MSKITQAAAKVARREYAPDYALAWAEVWVDGYYGRKVGRTQSKWWLVMKHRQPQGYGRTMTTKSTTVEATAREWISALQGSPKSAREARGDQ